eukprot:40230_1
MGACLEGDEGDVNQTIDASEPLKNQLSITILTWNVGTSEPGASMDALFVHQDFDTDICVVGLEEVVELNAKNVIIDDDRNDNLWKKKIQAILNQDRADDDAYSFLKSKDMVGIILFVFVKNSIKKDIQGLLAEESATGMGGVVGNKGGCGIRFRVQNTSICFVCCHLEAHKEEVEERNEDYHEILKELTFETEDEKTDGAILSHDVVFMFGDLNYRLNFDADQLQTVYGLINEKKYGELLEKDQLMNAIANKKAFVGFTEENINFQPTYKFEPGTNDYEQKKKRMPSYCDRILWRVSDNNKQVNCVKYATYLEQKLSDHKPVVGLYQVEL